MKARAARFFHDAPVLFIGLVLAIAVVFRLAIGAAKTASAEPEPPPPVVHTEVAPAVRAEHAEPVATTTAPARVPAPQKPMLPKRKPRAHGKR